MKKVIGYVLLAPLFLFVCLFYSATWLAAYRQGVGALIGYALAHTTILGLFLVLQDEQRSRSEPQAE